MPAHHKFSSVQAARHLCLVLLAYTHLAAAQPHCKDLLKEVNFDYATKPTPYTEDLANRDWAPYTYVDGFWGDVNTTGSDNRRAELLVYGKKTVLQVKLPKGCVGKECGMQTKALLSRGVEDATLQYMVKFGKDFDWVRGGKLPGLCGGECVSSCKEVTGLNGWSVASMWRPCQWPPVSPQNELACEGGKMAAYVYHMFKKHWCGDDFDFTKKYPTTLEDGTKVSFFQPDDDKWYMITNYVKMNTAGPPGQPLQFKQDGILRVWLDGALVVDKAGLAFRKYNNVTVDTLTFNSFFGGSSDSFRAKKNETIQFDGFKVWEGNCPPIPGHYDDSVDPIVPVWPGMKLLPGATSTLKASFRVESIFNGGGCAAVVIKNTGTRDCLNWVVELNTRPSWGSVQKYTGLEMLADDVDAGWLELAPRSSALQTIKAGATMDYVGFCVTTALKAKYLESQFHQNVAIAAYCTKSAPPAGKPVPTPSTKPQLLIPPAKPAACTGTHISPSYTAKFWAGKLCLDMTLVYNGAQQCHAFHLDLQLDPTVIDMATVYASRVTLTHDNLATGDMSLASPAYFKTLACGDDWATTICMSTIAPRPALTQNELEAAILKMVAVCTSVSST